MSREYTKEEIRKEFLDHLRGLAHYWKGQVKSGKQTPEEAIDGVVFSTLVTLDGCSGGMPGFYIAPMGSEENKQYAIENDENWYPVNEGMDDNLLSEFGGGLHEEFYNKEKVG